MFDLQALKINSNESISVVAMVIFLDKITKAMLTVRPWEEMVQVEPDRTHSLHRHAVQVHVGVLWRTFQLL